MTVSPVHHPPPRDPRLSGAGGPPPVAPAGEDAVTGTLHYRLALTAVISAIAGVGAALSLSLPLLSLVLEARGISPLWIGLNTAMGGVAAIAILPFVTRLASTFGTARLIVAGFLTMVVALNGFYLADAFWIWFPLRFVFSASITLIFALTEFWINSLAPPKRRGFIVGIYTAFLSVGIAAGPIILAVVGPHGYLPFLIGSVILAVAAVPVMVVRAREPELGGGTGRHLLSFLAVSPLAMLAALVFGAVESGGTALTPVYGLALGYTAQQAAILVSAVAIGNIVSQIPIGWLADRFDRRRLLIGCAAIGMIGALILPIVEHSYPALLFTFFVTGSIVAGLYTIGLTHLGSRFTGMELASANAAFVMMYAVGMLVGPASLGIGLELMKPDGFAYAIAAFFGLYVLVGVVRLARL